MIAAARNENRHWGSSRWRSADDQLFATVSGSFRRAMTAVQEAVYGLTDAGVRVLSPADPRVVAQLDDFLFVASDRLRAVKPVQSRHLAAIAASDFLWLVVPDGYVGSSTAMEIGYAVATRTAIYATQAPADLTLSQYVEVVSGIDDAVARAQQSDATASIEGVLVDPPAIVESAHADLDLLALELTQPGSNASSARDIARRLEGKIIAPLR